MANADSALASPASPQQRSAVRDRVCVVGAAHGAGCDPAHLVARCELGAGQDAELAVIPLCRACHDAYDAGRLDILPYLEPHWREHLAFAVARFGLIRTLERVTNRRWTPAPVDAC